MYRKFEFAAQPFFERNPAVQHPDFELIFSGVMEIDIEGVREAVQLYINDIEYHLYPWLEDKKSGKDLSRFRVWLNEQIINCNDSDEAQSKIILPPYNMYDMSVPSKKPTSNARWFDASELTAESAEQFAAIMGEVEAVGEGLIVTEFTEKTFN